MQRRSFIATMAALPLAACGGAQVQTFPTIESALAALDALAKAPKRSTGAWPLPRVLEHAAQSIEYSIAGFPEMKSGLFRATVGAAAFAVFDARGAMTHSLDEPIPGEPPSTGTLEAAVARLRTAFNTFAAHKGPLRPHFAYGELSHAQYTRAHLMHLANHWSEVVPA